MSNVKDSQLYFPLGFVALFFHEKLNPGVFCVCTVLYWLVKLAFFHSKKKSQKSIILQTFINYCSRTLVLLILSSCPKEVTVINYHFPPSQYPSCNNIWGFSEKQTNMDASSQPKSVTQGDSDLLKELDA